MTFVTRKLGVTITLAKNDASFKNVGGDTVTLPPLRMSARVNKAGGASDSTLDLVIYGMTESLMAQLSTFGIKVNLVPGNGITLTAGDDVSGMATVFSGYIVAAYFDPSSAPNIAFRINAHTGLPQSVIPAVASSFPGAADVATILSGLAAKMGLKFENNGVQTQLPPSYFSGSYKTQAATVVEHANISWNNCDNGVLAIWPKNGSRGGAIPVISPETGMIGYPIFDQYGAIINSLFNPSVGMGGQVEVKSSLPGASGTYNVYTLDYDLEAQVPGGKWQMAIFGYNPKFPTPAAR